MEDKENKRKREEKEKDEKKIKKKKIKKEDDLSFEPRRSPKTKQKSEIEQTPKKKTKPKKNSTKEEQNKKINLLKNNENSFKIAQKPQQSNIIFIKNQMKRSTYLNDVTIFFDFKNKKNEIGFDGDNNYLEEENKKIKHLIQMLKVKINKVVSKIEMLNIGCGGDHSFIYDNSFNFF
jgi:hypothetical protein